MTSLGLIASLLLAFVATALLVPPLIRVAVRRGWVDRPDQERKLHARPIPSVGGLAIAFGFTVGLVALALVKAYIYPALVLPSAIVLVGALVMIVTGFLDDTKGLGFKSKLAIQVVVAYALLHAGYRVDLSSLPFISPDVYDQALFSIPITMAWIVGIINAVNLIDGLDGLASGIALIAFATLGLIFGLNGELGLVAVAVVISGALVGFLVHNFNPASIFMGDSGSLFLGYMLAVFSMSGHAHADPLLALVIPVIALGLPVTDTLLSIVRRVVERRAICAPDSDHIHHRLTRLWTTRRAVLVLYGVALFFGAAAVSISLLAPPAGYGVLGLTTGSVLTGIWLLGYLRPGYSFETAPALKLVQPAYAKSSGDGHLEADAARLVVEPAAQRENNMVAVRAGDGVLRLVDEKVEKRKIGDRSDQNRNVIALFGTKPVDNMQNKPSYFVAGPDVTSAELGGEAVLLNLRSGHYYGVNELGARIWQMVQKPRSIDEIIKILAHDYDVDEEVLIRDVLAFLEQLKENDLVKAQPDLRAA